MSWFDKANCQGVKTDVFFVERPKGQVPRLDPDAEAKQVCRGCVVRKECLEYAIEHNERFGVWGGLGEKERRKLMRERRGLRSVPTPDLQRVARV